MYKKNFGLSDDLINAVKKVMKEDSVSKYMSADIKDFGDFISGHGVHNSHKPALKKGITIPSADSGERENVLRKLAKKHKINVYKSKADIPVQKGLRTDISPEEAQKIRDRIANKKQLSPTETRYTVPSSNPAKNEPVKLTVEKKPSKKAAAATGKSKAPAKAPAKTAAKKTEIKLTVPKTAAEKKVSTIDPVKKSESAKKGAQTKKDNAARGWKIPKAGTPPKEEHEYSSPALYKAAQTKRRNKEVDARKDFVNKIYGIAPSDPIKIKTSKAKKTTKEDIEFSENELAHIKNILEGDKFDKFKAGIKRNAGTLTGAVAGATAGALIGEPAAAIGTTAIGATAGDVVDRVRGILRGEKRPKANVRLPNK